MNISYVDGFVADEQISAEDCADMGRVILFKILSKFRPDLIKEGSPP